MIHPSLSLSACILPELPQQPDHFHHLFFPPMGACASCFTAPRSPVSDPLASEGGKSDDASSSSSSRVPLAFRSGREKKKSRWREKDRGGGFGRAQRASGSDSLPAEFDEDELHRVPGRLFLNGANDVASLYTQQGRKGTNQDAMIVWENFISRDDTIFCGIFDGHGPYGHMVAKKVRDYLPVKLSSHWRANLIGQGSAHQDGSRCWSMDSEEMASLNIDDDLGDFLDSDGKEKLPEMYLPLKQSFLKAFKSMDRELKFNLTIDCFCSGTTAVTLIKQGQDLVIGNLGDSRAVMGTRDKDNNLAAVQLTVDLKPNLPREAARIQQCRGRVFALHEEPEVSRVWLPNTDSPGLAMARAFGDFCLKSYGLISVPDVSYHHISEKDEFVVLATDGVWDVLSNKEVVDVVAAAPTRGTAARALVERAVRAWRLKFPTSKSDDCAAVCLFLNTPSSSDQFRRGHYQNTPNALEEGTSSGLPKQVGKEKQEEHESTTIGTHTSILDHSHTLGYTQVENEPEKCHSARSLADFISKPEEEDWSALEGVTRVNSLLNLPRTLPSEKISTIRKKKL